MTQAYVPSVDSVISHEVADLESCTLDELAQRLPAYSWAQVFAHQPYGLAAGVA